MDEHRSSKMVTHMNMSKSLIVLKTIYIIVLWSVSGAFLRHRLYSLVSLICVLFERIEVKVKFCTQCVSSGFRLYTFTVHSHNGPFRHVKEPSGAWLVYGIEDGWSLQNCKQIKHREVCRLIIIFTEYLNIYCVIFRHLMTKIHPY